MVRARPAVIMGCRVLWLVAAVTMVIVSLTAPAAPHSTPASFLSNRSEMKAEPSPRLSARRTSSMSWREESACPART